LQLMLMMAGNGLLRSTTCSSFTGIC
jgi:hypothetical protein